jgi:cupin fold WbuC family metalloprotein
MTSQVKILDQAMMDGIVEMARKSQKLRAVYNYHEQGEYLQRMLYAGLRDTYVRPHRHPMPVKLEAYLILKGRAFLPVFDDKGRVLETVCLDENGPVRMAEIPAGTWHSLVIDSEFAVFYELIEGKYDPFNFKSYAGWAPDEEEPETWRGYLKAPRERLAAK